MLKKFLTLLLILPLIAFCGNKETPQPEPDPEHQVDPEPEPEPEPEEDIYAKAAEELVNGTEVQATNPIAEKFVNEVTYPDHTYNQYTKILDYYGGFNGKAYNENGEEDPSGVVIDWTNYSKKGVWPDGDKPCQYSIRWSKADLVAGSTMTLKMQDNKGWKGELPIKEGMCYVNFSNLVPGAQYTYSVTADEGGKVLKQGNFSTKASSTLHQVFFSSNCRNGRDLGGWKTVEGKTVKYHNLYRGGRMQGETLSKPTGSSEVLFEGIGAQLDLRGSSDMLKRPAFEQLDFLAPCIEEGGQTMLGVRDPSTDVWIKWASKPEPQPVEIVGNWQEEKSEWEAAHPDDPWKPSEAQMNAFKTAYKEKTKACFEFALNSIKAGKPVYFHCSLGRDRTGTLDILFLGLLGVPEGQIGVAYEVTYFAPVGYSVSSSEKPFNPQPIFANTRMAWAYSDVVPYFWSLADTQDPEGFAHGVENYLLNVAGVAQKDINDFRSLMLE